MIANGKTALSSVEDRARQSLGRSDVAIHKMVLRALKRHQIRGGTLADIGCGNGILWSFVHDRFERYVGVDVVRYEDFPVEAEFCTVNLETGSAPLPDGSADVVAAVETIEHLENPRAFMRELVRLAKPGGWVIVTTPNQLSGLSLLTLVVKGQFQSFQESDYPAHLTALLSTDLKRIANECKLVDVQIEYSLHGRIVFTPWHYPTSLARLLPKWMSDNLLMAGRKPE